MKHDKQSTPSGTCPICSVATTARYRPFCSKRCADIDLGRWMTGHYATPVEEDIYLVGSGDE